MGRGLDVGVGLWCMRSTAAAPGSAAVLYRELIEDARLADELGLHSLWLSEHHFWYDGWCPSLLVAGAAVLGATTRLQVGTGVFLLPLHETARVAAAGLALEALAPGRTQLAVGLGYRDPEFDGFGVSRRTRGRRTGAALGELVEAWRDGGPRLWVGGIAERSLQRAADHGLSLFLPSSMRVAQLHEVVAWTREAAAAQGQTLARVGVLKDAWITDGSPRQDRAARAAIAERPREYGGSWWSLQGRRGFDVPELLEAQMTRSADEAIVGPPALIAERLAELSEAGVDLVVMHLATDTTRPAHREAMEQLSGMIVSVAA